VSRPARIVRGYGCGCRKFTAVRVESVTLELQAIRLVAELAGRVAEQDSELGAHVLDIAIRDKRRLCGATS
jgi:hypothetical protein